ncbi:phage tail protein [Acinetobacter lwoffii]|uniref:phage tail fiber protein n=1 Tax=Acinetobacter lwoffii TaxID=28090 RepID=UPI0032B44580
MAKQTINQGVAPTGAGGDTFRTGSAKLQANDDEIYNYLGDGTNLNKLGTAAFKNTGTQAGNVMEVGAFGLGRNAVYVTNDTLLSALGKGFITIGNQPAIVYGQQFGADYNGILRLPTAGQSEISVSRIGLASDSTIGQNTDRIIVKTTANTQVDPNGFIKAASPIVSLYVDKIELNDEAQLQEITFEKLGAGDYLIKGSSGFAQDGWYIETPKDANGNLLVAVVYEQLENGDISVKTYDYMLNKKGRIVADTETPLDIPEARWIDIRLQELPQPEIEMPESIAPPEFQPTGLAQAVATVMESYHDPEQ